jgi:hypothetical protein
MTWREDSFCDPGELRHPVELLRLPEAQDDFRGATEPTVYMACRSSWTPLRGDRAVVANQLYGRVTLHIKMRYDSRVKPGHRIRRRDTGELAAITAAVPVDGGTRWLEVMASEITTPEVTSG